MKSQRNSLVPLFVLAYMVTEVVEDVKDILTMCDTAVVGEDNSNHIYQAGEEKLSLHC